MTTPPHRAAVTAVAPAPDQDAAAAATADNQHTHYGPARPRGGLAPGDSIEPMPSTLAELEARVAALEAEQADTVRSS